MKHLITVLFFVSFPFVFATQAHAYIDPGTGSMMVQALLAAVAACAVGIGVFWSRFKDLCARVFGRNKNK
jgi:hypothetical protein